MAKGLIARRGGGPHGAPARGRRARRLRHHADERGRARRPKTSAITIVPPGRRAVERPGRGLRPLRDRADGVPRGPDAPGHRPAPRGHQVRSQHRGPLDPALPVADPDQRHRGRLHRRPEGRRARAQQRGRPHDDGRPLQAPAQAGGGGGRAGAGGGARPADARRLPGPGPAPLRGQELRQGARGAAAAGDRAPESLAGLLPAGAHRHRERAVGRGPDQPQARGGARPRSRRGVVRARLRLRGPEQARRRGRGLQGSAQGQSGQRGLRGAAGRSAREARALRRGPERDRVAGGFPAARSAGVAEAGRDPLRAEAVRQGGRRLPPGRRARARQHARRATTWPPR